jgi:hypothetical protein
MCVCVCVCARARACVFGCQRERERDPKIQNENYRLLKLHVVSTLKSSITVRVLRFCMQTSVCRLLRVDGDPVVLTDVHSVGEPLLDSHLERALMQGI